MLSIGIDSGSTMTKGILFDGKQIVDQILIPTTARPRESMEKVYQKLHNDEVGVIVTTGYGRNLFDKADKKVTEITCHARGAAYLIQNEVQGNMPDGVIDIGGQDCKAIKLKNGKDVSEFLMNDKCAAGTGRFMEVMMRLLGESMNSLDEITRDKEMIPISSMCTVFAESEVISLLAQEKETGSIALGIVHSICKRTANFAQNLNLNSNIFFTGGLARYAVFRETLEEYLKLPILTNELAQYAGAIGAAVIGYEQRTGERCQ